MQSKVLHDGLINQRDVGFCHGNLHVAAHSLQAVAAC